MHIIYRLQHKEDKRGPYKTFTGIRFNPKRHNDWMSNKYPNRADDLNGKTKGLFNYDEYYCACHKWSLFLSWFTPKEIKYLKSYGFEVVKLKVKKILIGHSGRQCFFKKKDIINH